VQITQVSSQSLETRWLADGRQDGWLTVMTI